MANILNFDAESQANMIGDDAQPTLTIENSSTGRGLDVTAAAAPAVRLTTTTGAANATALAPVEITGSSIASGAVMAFINNSAYVSTTTIKFATTPSGDCGVLRVVLPNGTFGWIPVLPDSGITGVAV